MFFSFFLGKGHWAQEGKYFFIGAYESVGYAEPS